MLIRINIILANSLGWNEPNLGIVNQHFDPFTSVPKMRSKKSKIFIKIYNIVDISNIFLQLNLVVIIINPNPIKYHITCLERTCLLENEDALYIVIMLIIKNVINKVNRKYLIFVLLFIIITTFAIMFLFLQHKIL